MKPVLDIPEIELGDISLADEPNAFDNEMNEMILNAEVEEVEVVNSKEIEDGWGENKVKMLLTLYLQNAEKFRNPKIKKKFLWKKIGQVLNKDADACDKKFRNLKQHYQTILGKKRRLGNTVVSWPFFNLFEEISNKVGFKLASRVRYRPILKKPECNPTQFVVLGNSATLKTPVFVNSVTPDNEPETFCANGNGLISNTRQRKIETQDLDKVSEEFDTRRSIIEQKLDRLVQAVEESNDIQRERNRLFEEYLKKLK